MSSKNLLVAENLSCVIGYRLLFSGISISFGQQKTGLVGANGAGKTTFLKMLVAESRNANGLIQTGSVYKNCEIGYLPQDFSPCAGQAVAQVLGIEQKLEALKKIDSGSATTEDYETVEADWDVESRATELLARLGLEHLSLDRKIETLSGGEAARVCAASVFLLQPEFVILDEPTNNLDLESRNALYNLISSFKGGVLVVSHDRRLLSFMDQIVEISSIGVKTYGGNYENYSRQKEVQRQATQQDLIDAKKLFKKTQKGVQRSKETCEQRAKQGRKLRKSGSQPKMFMDYEKARSEKTKSKLVQNYNRKMSSADGILSDAKSNLEEIKSLDFELEATRVHSSKLVLKIENLRFYYPGAAKPNIDGFNMTVVGPQRVAIAGPNGCGKTTLLKLISGELRPTVGTIELGVEQASYLDQNVAILDREKTILENFCEMNPSMKTHNCRARLATFLFEHDAMLQQVEKLSGGEKLRAALACVLMSDKPAQLILLDEPTNNLDLESIHGLEEALVAYRGAFLVVSHDEDFLKNVVIDKVIELG
jgi:ATPase subunit of ABC transporter with duplicated ATPase domains